MRLPNVSLAFAAAVLLHISTAAPEARAANAPMVVTSCMDLSEPNISEGEEVVPGAAAPLPVPTPLDARRLAAEEAYADVFRILSRENSCSRLFGGPPRAVEAFNRFARQLSSGRLGNPRIALRMSGTYTLYQDRTTGAVYRLFERAMINSDGPLGAHAGRPPVSRMTVGRYLANTPQARALVLLHELGHLVQAPRGGWLLPNDGNNDELSERNTRQVEAHCIEQLKAIRD